MSMSELQRSLGVWQAAAVSIGAIIGAGIFVLVGVASGLAGPAVILSFIPAGLAAMFTALCAAELSSFIPEAGGFYRPGNFSRAGQQLIIHFFRLNILFSGLSCPLPPHRLFFRAEKNRYRSRIPVQ